MRYVTVAALGLPNPALPMARDNESRIEAMWAHWEAALAPVLSDHPDLIVLPEVCDRYHALSLPARLAYYRARGDRIRDRFAQVARAHRTHIAYSAERELPDGTWRNSTQIIDRDGDVVFVYDKNHLPVYEGTPESGMPMLCGGEARSFELDFGRVACAICFDLNFDELKRQYMAQRPELILFSSMFHGGLLQRAWAYDCRSYFVGAVYDQECAVISPLGEVIAHSTNHFPHVVARINLDYALAHMDENGERFAAAKQKYGQRFGLFDPGRISAMLLTAESPELTIGGIIDEFHIERLDHYFERSRVSQRARIAPVP